MQRGGIKIGGSGGRWKSRLKGVDGCSDGVTVGEIALVVFYYSIIISLMQYEISLGRISAHARSGRGGLAIKSQSPKRPRASYPL